MLLTSAITNHQQTELLHEKDSVLLWLLCADGEDSEWRGEFSHGSFLGVIRKKFSALQPLQQSYYPYF